MPAASLRARIGAAAAVLVAIAAGVIMLTLVMSADAAQTKSNVRISVTPLLDDGHVVNQGRDDRGIAQGEKPETDFLQDLRLSILEQQMEANHASKSWINWPFWTQVAPAIATAFFTLALVYVGWSQVQIGARQTEIAERQFKAARVAEIRAHRPRLYVRNIVMQALPSTTRPASVSVIIANKGSERAVTIEAKGVLLDYVGSLPVDYGFEAHENLRLDANALAGGHSMIGWVDGNAPFPIEPIRINGLVPWHVYCLGKIRYHDESGALHVTGFGYVYERREGIHPRFWPLNEPSYEYEE